MWSKSLLLANLLMAVQVAHCMPAKNNETLSTAAAKLITFQLNNTVRINGTDFGELNCKSQNSLARKSCANITEVTCQEKQFGKVNSCLVSNEDSIFFNTSIINQTLVCNHANLHNQTKSNCYLIFSPGETSKSIGHLEKNGEFHSNPLLISYYDDDERRQREIEDEARRIQRIVFISMAVFLSLIFGIPILFCCLVIINNQCLGGRFNLPLDRLIRDTWSSIFGLRERDEFPDGVTITTRG